MTSALKTDIDGALGEGRVASAGLHAPAAGRIWSKFQTAPDRERWSRPWSLYVLEKWCEANAVTS
jgi:hypothetical protein